MLREAAPSRGHPWHAACPGDPPWEPTKRGGPIGGVVGPMALFPTFFFLKYVSSKWFSTFSNAKKSQALIFQNARCFFENDFEDHLETIGDGPWMGNVSA